MKISNIIIARVAHEVNRALCQAHGDNSQLPWNEAPDWQKEAALTGVKLHLEQPHASPSASHDIWLQGKKEAGWVYGLVKDSTLKTHPCIVPFDELPPHEKTKDYLFKAVVDSLSGDFPLSI